MSCTWRVKLGSMQRVHVLLSFLVLLFLAWYIVLPLLGRGSRKSDRPSGSPELERESITSRVHNETDVAETLLQHHSSKKYTSDWSSLDTRTIPPWYDQAKFGIFVHWGLFSVPSFGNEWFWSLWQNKDDPKYDYFMKTNYKPGFQYTDFAAMFTAEFFDPDEWAEIFQASGARYVVLTSKHHEGWTNWPSKYSWMWNSVDGGPHRDLVGELAEAVRKTRDMKFGVYYSLYEWYNPLYLEDKRNNFETNFYIRAKMMPQLMELVETYKPDVLWTDGEWEADSLYWNATDFLAWLYNDSPVKDEIVVNDRWGSDTRCEHGDFYTCADRYNPGFLRNFKWENCMTIDRFSWGYRREATLEDYLDITDLIGILVETVSCGGNLLMNMGPTADGRIVPIYEERLRQMGEWLSVNGEAIYGSQPWTLQKDRQTSYVWYTSQNSGKGTMVYAILLEWPKDGVVYLAAPKSTTATAVHMLGHDAPLQWKSGDSSGISVTLPTLPVSRLPCKWAWTLKPSSVV